MEGLEEAEDLVKAGVWEQAWAEVRAWDLNRVPEWVGEAVKAAEDWASVEVLAGAWAVVWAVEAGAAWEVTVEVLVHLREIKTSLITMRFSGSSYGSLQRGYLVFTI